jgi:A/G-specific adenine glycosylase
VFSKKLLHWHQHQNQRTMPWKGERNAYLIWISEIILQQTRVDQGTKYYEALTTRYPSVTALAQADETELFKLWQGLGYYNRCKNMLFTARDISTRLSGKFPDKYEDILALKGIGTYTAAAIASFAYNLPYAVVDGNVVRVLSRYFGLQIDFNTTHGKKEFQQLAQQLIDPKNSALYNQAIMDLGATICKPQQPLCEECPFQKKCVAFTTKRIPDFPVKKNRPALKHRYFHFLVLQSRHHIYIHKRTEKDIWQNLHTFYAIEQEQADIEALPYMRNLTLTDVSDEYTQLLTHQKIHGWFYKIKIGNRLPEGLPELMKVQKQELKNFAFPRMIISFLQKNNYL